MKSSVLGKRTSTAEVQDITPNGIWLLVNGREYMLSFEQYPWFKGAKVSDVLNVRLVHANHLYWPTLDVDLGIDVLEAPERFPMVAGEKRKTKYRPR